jgi:outer membrane protein assembly factor BamB
MKALGVFAAMLVLAGSAGGATARSVASPGPVEALAFDDGRIAYAAGRSAGDCDRVRIWTLSTRRVVRLGRSTPCVETSTGTGIADLAIAATRVLWLHYTGGNTREWSLFTASAAAPRPVLLHFAARPADAEPPIVLGDGDSGRLGAVLPYAFGRRVVALRADGRRRFSWSASARVVELSASPRLVAVAQEGGTVTVLDLSGRVVREERYAGGEIDAVKLVGGGGVLAQLGQTLEYRPATGGTWSTVLPARARLVDVTRRLEALYVVREEVHARRLGAAGAKVVGRGALAQAEGPWLATAAGRTVTARRIFSP